jgi:hypothetical protein
MPRSIDITAETRAQAVARSNRHEVRNPVLALPSVKRLMELPPEQQELIADILNDLVIDARQRAQTSWRQNKGPMAAYWKAVGAYAHHFRRVVRKNISRAAEPMLEAA